jgi:hypothetical protein
MGGFKTRPYGYIIVDYYFTIFIEPAVELMIYTPEFGKETSTILAVAMA